jgi:proteasome lid subunit RPN8/RPN11
VSNVLQSPSALSSGRVLDVAADTLGARARTQGQFEFVMDPAEFNRVQREAAGDLLEVVGLLHTHPDHPARPSAADTAQPLLAGYSVVIVSVRAGRFVEALSYFREEDDRPLLPEPLMIEEEDHARP